MKILNVIVQNEDFRYCDNNFVLSFAVDDSVENPMANLRLAINEYGQTPDGRRDVDYACGYYNWGDAAHAAMEDILAKYGLRAIASDCIDIFVNHDEILIDRETTME